MFQPLSGGVLASNEEPERFRSMAAELATLKPDVILAAGAAASTSRRRKRWA